jgi:Mg2+ and Co2+ transporter CorA
MIRSLVFTTQGRLHSKDIDPFLMPTLLNDTNLFLWVDLDQPTPEEARLILETTFHFHPLANRRLPGGGFSSKRSRSTSRARMISLRRICSL